MMYPHEELIERIDVLWAQSEDRAMRDLLADLRRVLEADTLAITDLVARVDALQRELAREGD